MEKFFSIAFCSHFLIANNFLQKNLKTQADSFFFFGTIQIFESLQILEFLCNNQQNFKGTCFFKKSILISEFQNAEFYKKSKS